MKPAEPHFLKINLEKDAKRCGSCQFCSRYEIRIYSQDAEMLRDCSRQILEAKPDILIKTEYVLPILSFLHTLCNEKVYCHKEKTWTHFLDPGCALWQPRTLEKSTV